MTDLIGSGKIVGLIEFSSEYFYNPDSYVRKIGPLFPVVSIQKPSFTLIPNGGWSGAGKHFVRLAQKPVPTVVNTVRTFNKPIESIKKLGQGYCMDTSLMLIEGDSKSLSKALTYAPRKVLRLALWGATRKTKIGKIGGIGIACAVGSYEIYRIVCPTDTKIDAFIRGTTFTFENYINDNSVEQLGLKVCNRWITSETLRKFVCKVVSFTQYHFTYEFSRFYPEH